MLAWSVRLGLVAAPLVVSIALAWSLTALTPQPSGLVAATTRWLAIAAISSAALVVLERLARRLLPIAALLDLTLAFPDQAPSRFKVALRTGTTGQLAQRIAEARSEVTADPSVGAGQRVIELVAALRVHDRITRGHSERVRAYTQMIADEMGLPEDEREQLRWAGLLHDVGKLLVPTSILNKIGRLTPEEYEIIKSHPENGRLIIEELVPWLGESARAVWEHHEKWDGTGYPQGLAGEEISLAARIVAVADVYDVMTSARSYKDPVSPKQARAELARCAGSHFDPVVVRAFLNISLGRVRRAAGPLSWLAQLALFPTAAIGSTKAAGSAVVLTGALSASSAGVGTELVGAAWPAMDPVEMTTRADTRRGTSVAGPYGFSGDAFVVVTTPPTVVSRSSPTTDRLAYESINVVVVRPVTDVPATATRPGWLDSGSITTIPPQVHAPHDAVASPPTITTRPVAPTPTVAGPPTVAQTPTIAMPNTIAPPTSVPLATVPPATVPPTTAPSTTAPPTTGTTVPPATVRPTTVPMVEPPPVTLPNGTPGPAQAATADAGSGDGNGAAVRSLPGVGARAGGAGPGSADQKLDPEKP